MHVRLLRRKQQTGIVLSLHPLSWWREQVRDTDDPRPLVGTWRGESDDGAYDWRGFYLCPLVLRVSRRKGG